MAQRKPTDIARLESLGRYFDRLGAGSVEAPSPIREIGPPLPAKRKPPKKEGYRAVIPDDVVRQVRELRKTCTYPEIAQRLNVTLKWVRDVCNGTIRGNVK